MGKVLQFRKRPVEIEAVQFTGTNWPTVNQFVGKTAEDDDGELHWGFAPAHRDIHPDVLAVVWDKLHSTWVGVKAGQWIIKGIQGEFYPCDPEVFHATYEEIK